MERKWVERGWWWLLLLMLIFFLGHIKPNTHWQRVRRRSQIPKISSNDRSRAYFPYNYLISKSVITWQKQKFSRINGWRAECVLMCTHIVYLNHVECAAMMMTTTAATASIDYVWYIHNIGFDARDIVPTMLIMFPINKYKHSDRHSHMCVYDLTHWDTQPFYMCTFVWQNNLMPLFIFQKQVPKTQTSERINKQFKFSSFKCAYFSQKMIISRKACTNNRYETCTANFNVLLFWFGLKFSICVLML